MFVAGDLNNDDFVYTADVTQPRNFIREMCFPPPFGENAVAAFPELQRKSLRDQCLEPQDTRQKGLDQAPLKRTHLIAFWEDQLFGEEERSAVRFRIGEVNFAGRNPCARCPVPPRDPQTGEIIPGFQKTFSDHRRSHIPAWTPEGRFDHYYRLATNTRVAPAQSGTLLRINDLVID
jgi:hypothetical protein